MVEDKSQRLCASSEGKDTTAPLAAAKPAKAEVDACTKWDIIRELEDWDSRKGWEIYKLAFGNPDNEMRHCLYTIHFRSSDY